MFIIPITEAIITFERAIHLYSTIKASSYKIF
jgi:hypothetical protein